MYDRGGETIAIEAGCVILGGEWAMNQGGTRTKLDSDTDGYSTDDSKRKREEASPDKPFKRSRKTERTPTKSGKNMSEFKELKEMMSSLMRDMKELREENREYRKDINELKGQNKVMEGEIKSLRERVERLSLVEDKFEKMDRINRRENIIVSGLNLEGGNIKEVNKGLEQFLKQNLKVDVGIVRMHKINPKMWMARVESFDKKIEILTNKHKLRDGTYKRVYINSDLTEQERAIQKKIRERADKEKSEGKRVKVGYQRLTMDGKRWNWNDQLQELEEEGQNAAAKNDTR